MEAVIFYVILGLFVILALYFSIEILKEHERAVIFRSGRPLMDLKGPGVVTKIPLVDKLEKLNIELLGDNEAIALNNFSMSELRVSHAVGKVVTKKNVYDGKISISGDSLLPVKYDRLRIVEDKGLVLLLMR